MEGLGRYCAFQTGVSLAQWQTSSVKDNSRFMAVISRHYAFVTHRDDRNRCLQVFVSGIREASEAGCARKQMRRLYFVPLVGGQGWKNERLGGINRSNCSLVGNLSDKD